MKKAAASTTALANPFTVAKILSRYNNVRSRFSIWHTHWQLISEWIFTRKANFTGTVGEGEFLDREMFNMSGPMCLNLASSAFIGLVWPGGADSFEILPDDAIADDKDAQDYFSKVTSILSAEMDDPAAGLANALSEYTKELLAFGNGAIGVDKGSKSKLKYENVSLQQLVFDEGTKGVIDVIFRKRPFTIEQMVREYGLENCPEDVRKCYVKGEYDAKRMVIHAILPRPAELQKGPANSHGMMPYISVHIDETAKAFLRISGFEEPAIIVGRMETYANEVPGRGPGSRALPEIVKANAIEEAIMLATEKKLEPPIFVWDDLANTTIDKSAGAVNVFRPNGQISVSSPVGELFSVGSLQEAVALLERTEQNIKSHFYLDRLLDLSDQVMTAYQTATRNILRSQTLNDPTKRQYNEVLTPLITRSLNILWRENQLGAMPGTPEYNAAVSRGGFVIPQSVVKLINAGHNAWKVRYKTPAIRDSKAQSVQNNLQFVQAISATANAFQDSSVLMVGNPQEIIRDVAEGLGVTNKGIHTRTEVADAMKQVQDKQQQQQDLQALAAGATAGSSLTNMASIAGAAKAAKQQTAA